MFLFMLLCQPRADIRIRIRQAVIHVDVTGPAIRAVIHVAAANNNPRGPRLLNESRFSFPLVIPAGLAPGSACSRGRASGPPRLVFSVTQPAARRYTHPHSSNR